MARSSTASAPRHCEWQRNGNAPEASTEVSELRYARPAYPRAVLGHLRAAETCNSTRDSVLTIAIFRVDTRRSFPCNVALLRLCTCLHIAVCPPTHVPCS